jgi:hypothetical protein
MLHVWNMVSDSSGYVDYVKGQTLPFVKAVDASSGVV